MNASCSSTHRARAASPCHFGAIGLPLLACLLSTNTILAADAPAAWRAGVARTKITPPQPVWMAGYASRTKPADGTLNDLWAKALVFEDAGGKRVALISLDVCGIDRDTSVRICDRLKAKYALDRDAVAICVSHTHSGPVIGHNLRPTYVFSAEESDKVRAYTTWMEEQVVETVGRAAGQMAPVSMNYGVGTAAFATNRRENKEAEVTKLAHGDAGGTAAWRKTMKGPFDHDLPVLSVVAAGGASAGKPIAVLFGYACHATTLSGYEWSSDWPGFAAEAIEADLPGATAMFAAGCGADQNPFPRREVAFAKSFGRQIGDGVKAAFAAEMKPIGGTIAATYREIDLPFGEMPSRELLEQQKASTDPKDRYLARRASLLLERMARDGKLSTTYAYPVQSWKLGDGPTLVFLGGEVVVDYALRLKKELGGTAAVWPIGYANDVMAYIPSARVLKEGGYEGAAAMVYYGLPTVWGGTVEEKIIAEATGQVTRGEGGKPGQK
ncbi:neutral/alkaline non-lysosomal ceramidase N-terminal domain-containing protein [Humisphaera borealis]|uniref:Neutral ceramidase n=1 Tax=Humisphaera borealis TaxID=2807512 RepID=A0A7M2WSR3_9BACT|nr:neutral/alkaline non-lysosomal ceramidase N-terminal domain-containing protein [Humisphaera borealis]QOV87851.1 neutral/alkaline non-lysosomal ceramidase N-terminal domain-containing protein [Humisphaera borealis]